MYNSSSICALELYKYIWMSYVGIAVNCCALCFSALTIFTIWKTPSLHNNANIYIASMAVCNFLEVTVFIIHCSFNLSQFSQYVLFAKEIDTVIMGTAYSVSLSTALHMAVIAIDRYIYILKPLYYIRLGTKFNVHNSVLFAWAVPLIHAVIPPFVYGEEKFHTRCILLHPPVVYFVLTFTYFVVIAVIVCVCYFRIAYVAFERNKALNAQRLPNSALTCMFVSTAKGRAFMRSLMFVIASFGSVLLCYTPTGIVTLLSVMSCTVPAYLTFPLMYFFTFHGIFQFLIYLQMNNSFRCSVKRQLSVCPQICCRERTHF